MSWLIIMLVCYIVSVVTSKISNEIYIKYCGENLIVDKDDLYLTFVPIINIFGSMFFFIITISCVFKGDMLDKSALRW